MSAFAVLAIIAGLLFLALAITASQHNQLREAVKQIVLRQAKGESTLSFMNELLMKAPVREVLRKSAGAYASEPDHLFEALAALTHIESGKDDTRQALLTIFHARPDMENALCTLIDRMIRQMDTMNDSDMVRDIMIKIADGNVSSHPSYLSWLTRSGEIMEREKFATK